MEAIGETGGQRVRIIGWGLAAALILTPLAAMQVTPEVVWGPEDFVFAIVVIGGTGLLFEVAVRLSGNLAYRVGAGLALLASFLMVWVNAAVGIVGESDNPANLIFAGVLLLELAGTLLARFRAQGMAYAIGVTAGAQLLAAGYAAVNGWGKEALFLMVWVALWSLSAGLFQVAARQEAGQE